MKTTTALAALCLGLGLPAAASASCFFVYNGDQLIYRSTRPPIDLSRQIHEGLTGRLAGAHLTMIPDETGCPELLANGISEVFVSTGFATPTQGRSAIDASPLFRGGAGGVGDASTTEGSTPPSGTSRAPGRRGAPAAAPTPARGK